MPIPPEFINQLNERTDLVELIGAHVNLQRRGDNWVGLCPFHSEKTPSFTVQSVKGFFHCFGCGAHGNALGFVQKYEALDFLAAVDKLAARQGLTVPQQGGKYKQSDSNQKLLADAISYFKQQLSQSDAAKGYLKSRGVNGKTAALYKIGYAPDVWHGFGQALEGYDAKALIDATLVVNKNDKSYNYFRNRIIFPIIDNRQRICGFGGRAVDEKDQPKYLNSAESSHFSKRRILYGLPQAMKATQQKKRLIICEGYMDVIMLAQAGFSESVATMGTAATAEQMRSAARYATNIYLAYDGDLAGQKGAFRAMQGILASLKDGISIFFIFLPTGHDPDSYIRDNGAEAFSSLLEQGIPLGEYFVQSLAQQAEAEAVSREGQATNMIKESARLLHLVGNDAAPAWRALLQKKIEQYTGIPLTAAALRRYQHSRPAAGALMPPQSMLYQLICCLSVRPRLIENIPHELPLFGARQDVDIVATVIEKLRWTMEEQPDVPGLLGQLGYGRLAREIQSTLHRRYNSAPDVDAEVDFIINGLYKKHNRLVKRGKQAWLEKLQDMSVNKI